MTLALWVKPAEIDKELIIAEFSNAGDHLIQLAMAPQGKLKLFIDSEESMVQPVMTMFLRAMNGRTWLWC